MPEIRPDEKEAVRLGRQRETAPDEAGMDAEGARGGRVSAQLYQCGEPDVGRTIQRLEIDWWK